MNSLSRRVTATLAVMLVATVAAGCSDSDDGPSSADSAAPSAAAPSAAASPAPVAATPSTAPADTVTSKSGPLGKILLDNKGRTIYVFDADKSTKSTCTGSCAAAWPPLVVKGKPKAGSGVKADMLDMSTRSDGGKQVTYNGHPLYLYSADKKPGDTNGQGLDQFGAKWYVMGTNGKQITKSSGSGVGGY